MVAVVILRVEILQLMEVAVGSRCYDNHGYNIIKENYNYKVLTEKMAWLIVEQAQEEQNDIKTKIMKDLEVKELILRENFSTRGNRRIIKGVQVVASLKGKLIIM